VPGGRVAVPRGHAAILGPANSSGPARKFAQYHEEDLMNRGAAMLDLRRLRRLRELARRGTIAAVAEALSFSPSAVSQQLAALEKEAGVRLLEPTGRRVRLTPQGDLLVAHTQVL